MDASSLWASNQRRNLFIHCCPSIASTHHLSYLFMPTPPSGLELLSVGYSLQFPGRIWKHLCLSPVLRVWFNWSWGSRYEEHGKSFPVTTICDWGSAPSAPVEQTLDHPTCYLPRHAFSVSHRTPPFIPWVCGTFDLWIWYSYRASPVSLGSCPTVNRVANLSHSCNQSAGSLWARMMPEILVCHCSALHTAGAQ